MVIVSREFRKIIFKTLWITNPITTAMSQSFSETHYSAVNERLYLAQNVDEERIPTSFRCFRPPNSVYYHSLCDDFGPMNLSSIADFISSLESELSSFPNSKIIFCIDKGRRNMTNAVFLVGAYMILMEGLSPTAVAENFEGLTAIYSRPFATRPTLNLISN